MNCEKEMRVCPKHGLTVYAKYKDGKYRCRKCICENVSLRRRKLKIALVEYKGGKCEICGYNKSYRALEFHHLDTSKKEFGIAHSGTTKKFDILKKEVDKCILVCSNCHAELHDKIEDLNRIEKLNIETQNKENYIRCGYGEKAKIVNVENSKRVLELLKDGKSQKEIAKILDFSLNSVKRIINKYNLEHKTVTRFNPSRNDIIQCFKKSSSMKEAASKFGVNRGTLSRACKKYGLSTSINDYKGVYNCLIEF